MVQNKEEDKKLVRDYEIVDLEDLLVALDEQIIILESESDRGEVKELMINLTFAIRTLLLYLMALRQIIGINKVKKIIDEKISNGMFI